MVLGGTRLAMTRYGFAENRLDVMACDTFGWTVVALINQAVPCYRKLLSPCFVGTIMRSNATYISRMFLDLPWTPIVSLPRSSGNRPSGKANGLPGVGLFKSFLLQYLLTFILKVGNIWVIRDR